MGQQGRCAYSRAVHGSLVFLNSMSCSGHFENTQVQGVCPFTVHHKWKGGGMHEAGETIPCTGPGSAGPRSVVHRCGLGGPAGGGGGLGHVSPSPSSLQNSTAALVDHTPEVDMLFRCGTISHRGRHGLCGSHGLH